MRHVLFSVQVVQDRQWCIDAAVVRVMKRSRTLAHDALMTELRGQIKFPVTAADIKARIESLLEQEYIARAEEDWTVYRYVD